MRIETSEYCTVGHPDRMCDYIASFILDRHLERDRFARVALEVQFKDRFVTVSGEVTSSVSFTDHEIAGFVRDAVREVGYTAEYQAKWGEENTVCCDDLEVTVHLSRQSADIALGVDADGWGDQGIMFGMATDDLAHGSMPRAYALARRTGQALMESGIGGLDIKTQVTVEDGLASEVIVAVPLLDDAAKAEVERVAREVCGNAPNVIVNGTGRYVKHGPVGDCGTTGRKLAVDFYGGSCRIGGGSPWGKDPTKADVTLNILARKKAVDFMRLHRHDRVYVQLSCCIGNKAVRTVWSDESGRVRGVQTDSLPPDHVIEDLRLREPRYAETCRRGLFGFEA